jgi:hypothetical protein
MAIEITHVRFGGTVRTADEIIRYRWVNPESGKVGEIDKPSLVAWLEVKGGEAHVGSGAHRVRVAVVRPGRGTPYLRTHADGLGANNLVNLDTF